MIRIDDRGENTTIAMHESVGGECTITVRGKGNRLVVGPGVTFPKCTIELNGNDSEIHLGLNCTISGILRCRSDAARIEIGNGTTIQGATITMHEPGTVRIGNGCMLSGEIRMDCSDMHSIIDIASKRRINAPADIVIEDHVWIGFRVFVTKGVRIGEGAIVGACSTVARDVPPNCVVVGVPAKVVRRGVRWDRKLLPLDVELPDRR